MPTTIVVLANDLTALAEAVEAGAFAQTSAAAGWTGRMGLGGEMQTVSGALRVALRF